MTEENNEGTPAEAGTENEAGGTEETQVETSASEESVAGRYEEPDYGEILAEEGQEIASEQTETQEGAPPAEQETRPPETPEGGTEPAPEQVPGEATAAAPPEEGGSAAPAETPQAAPAVAEAPTQEEYAQRLAEHRQKTMAVLEKQYALSPEEAAKMDDLEAKPSDWIPGLLAQTHYNAYMSIWNAIQQTLPAAVERITAFETQKQQAANQFFERWPQLRGKEDAAAKAVQAILQVEPNAPLERVIERGGALAMMELGQNPFQQESSPPAPEPQTPPPAMPANPAAVGGAGPATQPGSYEEQVYAEMLREEV